MSNVPPWMSKWARSPRQDRRVVENGKFVELGQVHVPEPPPAEEVTEREQSALELVVPAPNVPEQEQISSTVFEEARYESAEEQEGSAGANVLPDTANGSSEGGSPTSSDSIDGNSPTTVGAVGEISNPTVSTPEGPSVSEASQAELEPISVYEEASKRMQEDLDAVAEHIKGSQTVAQIVEALEPLPGSVYEEGETRDYSDFIKKTDDIPF